MKAYELQAYRNGQWMIQGVFNDRELALFEARRIDESNRFPSVRVIEENYNEATNRSRTRTIFRGGRVKALEKDEREQQNMDRQRQHRVKLRVGGGQSAWQQRSRAPFRASRFVAPLLILMVIVVSGLAALHTLQKIFQQL